MAYTHSLADPFGRGGSPPRPKPAAPKKAAAKAKPKVTKKVSKKTKPALPKSTHGQKIKPKATKKPKAQSFVESHPFCKVCNEFVDGYCAEHPGEWNITHRALPKRIAKTKPKRKSGNTDALAVDFGDVVPGKHDTAPAVRAMRKKRDVTAKAGSHKWTIGQRVAREARYRVFPTSDRPYLPDQRNGVIVELVDGHDNKGRPKPAYWVRWQNKPEKDGPWLQEELEARR